MKKVAVLIITLSALLSLSGCGDMAYLAGRATGTAVTTFMP
jgi:uncharacterized protein YceK